ncbi:MAG TPA: hypothetical protein VHA80_13360 [Solirubrobacterales bacterium]|nr:hypothetical protein [Solirubrobacterales bacterium]
MSHQGACEVCGRTFLVGEKVHSYVSVEGRHQVCELCVERVAAAGWLPADQEGAEERLRAEAGRKPGFFGRLFARAGESEREVFDEGDLSRDEDEEAPAEPRAPRRREIHELETERYDVEAEWRGEEEESNPTRRLRLGRRLGDAAAPHQGRSEWPAADAADEEDVSPSPVRRRLSRLFAPRRPDADSPHGRAADLPAPDAPEASAEQRAEVPHGQAADLPSPDSVPEPEHSPPPPAPAPAPDASPAPLPDPAGRGMRPRRLQPDLSPTSRFERAIARFNSSDAGRTAAGLTRTLGAPSVSVGDLAGEEDIVRITVAWELTWYQWGVDLGDELRPVFELDKGYEVAEIDAAARQWNASAHEGRIVLVAPRRQEAADDRPVHR